MRIVYFFALLFCLVTTPVTGGCFGCLSKKKKKEKTNNKPKQAEELNLGQKSSDDHEGLRSLRVGRLNFTRIVSSPRPEDIFHRLAYRNSLR
ncbi:hypothetical protein Pmar_PMAR024277 [Perkinsus marinus ATCC 50983]|uniref:Secreted protein n=1 Tax=Perkinsus marinus (strain ATCC 50983 / TXsc) TaxID=423536 RepID=C5L9B3_PERM5|nr:hypothetical protein Pmar_PMAR024277 [Perkinsus marinus ATCC 50983]EER06684.1 hypothetical protein Pmar_PMAR024277 [Perkinsus marinus ATCC 50983]|eukprot:XP_002774868.1 hypothetical protein Pmar_PMAR024277 [Perkinsus marinus ATCC 50983]